jgi:WD40 repeat protein
MDYSAASSLDTSTLTCKKSIFPPPFTPTSKPLKPLVEFCITHPADKIPCVDGAYARVVVSPDGQRVYASVYRHVGVWEVFSGKLIAWLDQGGSLDEDDEKYKELLQSFDQGFSEDYIQQCHDGLVDDVVLSSCGKFLITAGGFDVMVWDTEQLRLERMLDHVGSRIGDARGELLLMHNTQSKYWLLSIGENWHILKCITMSNCERISSEVKFVFLRVDDSNNENPTHIVMVINFTKLVVVEAFSGVQIRLLDLEPHRFRRIAVHPTSNLIVVTNVNDGLLLWHISGQIESHDVVKKLPLQQQHVTAICLSEYYVAVSCDGGIEPVQINEQKELIGSVRLWKLPDCEEQTITLFQGEWELCPHKLCFSPDGNILVGGMESGYVCVWFGRNVYS